MSASKKQLIAALADANRLCRAMRQITWREGRGVDWKTLDTDLIAALRIQNEILYPVPPTEKPRANRSWWWRVALDLLCLASILIAAWWLTRSPPSKFHVGDRVEVTDQPIHGMVSNTTVPAPFVKVRYMTPIGYRDGYFYESELRLEIP